MNYATTARRPNPAAMLGVLGIPAAAAALLITGLTVTVIVQPKPDNPQGVLVKPIEIPPDPIEPLETTSTTETQQSAATTTITRPSDIAFDFRPSDTVITLPPLDTGGPIGPVEFRPPDPVPSPQPFTPVSAAPRGNPGGWVTNNDYRTRWINEGLTGTARFTVSIDANGKVTGCTITRSSGHAALDDATCSLITRRAKFTPARDGSGKAAAGSYSSSVNWSIPE